MSRKNSFKHKPNVHQNVFAISGPPGGHRHESHTSKIVQLSPACLCYVEVPGVILSGLSLQLPCPLACPRLPLEPAAPAAHRPASSARPPCPSLRQTGFMNYAVSPVNTKWPLRNKNVQGRNKLGKF